MQGPVLALNELLDVRTWCIDHANSGADAMREKHRVSGPPAYKKRGVWKDSLASTCLA